MYVTSSELIRYLANAIERILCKIQIVKFRLSSQLECDSVHMFLRKVKYYVFFLWF